ncbi:hypothetical protein TNIN_282101 [Trichonephila inaurata madagascariensis]|uniref:Uncharacterized protein n=1 Tax=Trichonephila inaurata madagascariensis TaxID=2747483 RepID=A0A8X6XFK0_9ARAC|nr:hypothetical protein TNIN_282101 [Trichonephila inaurata madagascariensis]
MCVGGIPVLLGTIFLAVGASAQSENDFLSIINCVATSGNEDMCQDFLDCSYYFAQPFANAEDICTQALTPEGPGKCTEDQELYRNEETRKAINECITSLVTEELTDDQKEEMGEYMECVKKVGDMCSGGGD